MTTEATNHLKLAPAEHKYYAQMFGYVTEKAGDDFGNILPAAVAAEFLKSSGLSIEDLKKIWRLSCVAPDSMNKSEFMTAMKLVALKQQGLSFSIENLKKECPLPQFTVGPKPKNSPQESTEPKPTHPMTSSQQMRQFNFAISESTAKNIEAYIDNKCKTEQKGVLSKKEAQELFSAANLNDSQRSHLWSLCDTERKGYLLRPQFIVCLYFISQVKQGTPLPHELPHKLVEFIEKYEGTLEPMPSPLKKDPSDTYGGLVNLLLKKCLDQKDTIETINEKNKNILEDLDKEVT